MTRRSYALSLAGMICMGAVFAIPNQQAFAHTFSGDESASFLALVESIKVELGLVQSNLASNVTLAEEHASEHLDEHIIKEISEKNERLGRDLPAALEDLHDSVANSTAQQVQAKVQNINDLLGETITVRIANDQMSNSTVWALVIANMADGVIAHYGEAYGVETEEGEEHDHDEENGMTHNETETASTEENMTVGNGTIVNMVHYQSALGLASRTQELFSEQVKGMAPANSTEFVAKLEAGLEHLKQAIDDKEPLADVETTVHSEVHANLQSTFNLQVIPEFPLPLLMTIPTIAGIIAASRIRALRRK